jgi:methyl-accepting chemotaxis protein
MDESSKEVENGVQSASQAGIALNEIISAAEEVKKKAGECSEIGISPC